MPPAGLCLLLQIIRHPVRLWQDGGGWLVWIHCCLVPSPVVWHGSDPPPGTVYLALVWSERWWRAGCCSQAR